MKTQSRYQNPTLFLRAGEKIRIGDLVYKKRKRVYVCRNFASSPIGMAVEKRQKGETIRIQTVGVIVGRVL